MIGGSTVELVHGAKMPCFGLGTWPMTDAEVERIIIEAVAAGYRLIDTAFGYRNESGVGKGVLSSGVPRAELFVTSKLIGDSHGFDAAQQAYQASVDRAGLEYLDLYLIHWPLPAQDRYIDAWRGLVKLLEDRRVRAIGTSNFKPAHLERLLAETGVVPDVNQIELNPYVSRNAARAHNAQHGIVTQSWSPLGNGNDLLTHPLIVGIAANRAKTPAQVVLRWHVELGAVPIPKSARPERVRENIDIFDFALTDEEIAAISSLDRGEAAAVDSDETGV